MLKKFWPTPFKVKEKDVNSFVVQLIIFVVVCAIAGAVIGILTFIILATISLITYRNTSSYKDEGAFQ